METGKRMWIAMVVLVACARLLPHPWNFTPLMAIGLFSGYQARKAGTGILVTLAALALSDLILGFTSDFWFVYAAALVAVLLGRVARNRGSVTVTVSTQAVQQQLSADVAVLALGSWSGAVAGVTLPVRPVKGQLLVFPGGAGPERIVYWGHNYLLTKPDGSVIVGATMEEAGFSIVTDQHAQELRPVLERMWPGLAEAPATARAGLRPASPDGLPISGWLPGGDVYAFTAHFRNGFLLSPLAARLAANEIGGGGDEELLRGLRPGRFEPSRARRP